MSDGLPAARLVMDDPEHPDPGFAELYASLPDVDRWVAFELLNPHWLAAGAGAGIRIRGMDRRSAQIEVDYPGGWTQEAEVALVWPEGVEALMEETGLELELMRAADPVMELAASSSFYVLARSRKADRLSSNAP